MLKSFLYAVLKVYIYIRSDWYEPVTFFVYIENCISITQNLPAGRILSGGQWFCADRNGV